ncbi:MAG: FecR domain-containing protein [Phycisphaerae bacterium]|nr:FecR domain-containing protein [Phycisphaerae bacterium]
MLDKQTKDNLSVLIVASLEGTLSVQQKTQLNNLLDANATARQYYMEYIDLHVSIKQVTEIPEVPDAPDLIAEVISENYIFEDQQELSSDNNSNFVTLNSSKQSAQQYHRKQLSFTSLYQVLGAIAAMIAVAFILNTIMRLGNQLPTAPIILAKLSDSVDAIWSGDVEVGDSLYRRTYELQSGYAEVTFPDNTKVVFQGPAEFELESRNSVYVEKGKLTAIIGDNIGFTVNSKNVKVVDVGTEFGVDIDGAGNSDVHVFDGEILLYPALSKGQYSKTAKQSIYQGQARRVDGKKQITEIAINELAFIRQKEFEIISRGTEGSSYDRWLAYSYQMRHNPDLVAYYTFDKNENQPEVLENLSIATKGSMDGQLQSTMAEDLPEWTTGRFPEKCSLAFDRDKNQQVVVPRDKQFQITGPITIAAWVDANASGQIVTNRIPAGHCNYRMTIYKNLLEFMRIDVTQNYTDAVNSVLADDADAKWHLVAVTHDNKVVKFYFDGELVGNKEYEYYPKAINANLFIGADGSSKGSNYYFNGRIDELAIFKCVISEKDIRGMYQQGKPQ